MNRIFQSTRVFINDTLDKVKNLFGFTTRKDIFVNACYNGDLDSAEKALENITFENWDGETFKKAFFLSSVNGFLNIVKYLFETVDIMIENKSFKDWEDDIFIKTLTCVGKNGNLDTFKYIVEKIIANDRLNTILHSNRDIIFRSVCDNRKRLVGCYLFKLFDFNERYLEMHCSYTIRIKLMYFQWDEEERLVVRSARK